MKKNKRLCILLTLYFSIGQIDAQTPLSFEESLHLLNQGNQSLKIADKSIEIAKAERDKLNAFWYPSLQSTGAFVHMSEKIEVKQPLSQFTDPAKDFVHSIIPDDQIISSILDQIGANTLIFPLILGQKYRNRHTRMPPSVQYIVSQLLEPAIPPDCNE